MPTQTVIHAPAGSRWYLTTERILTTPTVTTTSTTTIDPWIIWNDTITSTTNHVIWRQWINDAGAGTGGQLRLAETPEQQAARFAAQEAAQAEGRRIAQEMNEARAAAQAVKNAARDKARALLLSQLDDRQRVELASNGWFELETIQPSGERRRYRIRRGRAGNVELVDAQGNRLRRYCCHPVIDCPDEDTMLTQKLWIERNEEQFLRLANVS